LLWEGRLMLPVWLCAVWKCWWGSWPSFFWVSLLKGYLELCLAEIWISQKSRELVFRLEVGCGKFAKIQFMNKSWDFLVWSQVYHKSYTSPIITSNFIKKFK
jgi:hypothetical protein